MYETFEHTADVGLRVRAPDLDTLFHDAALGLFALIVEPRPTGGSAGPFAVEITGERLDFLLFDWLAELLYVFDSERVVLDRFEVHVAEGRVRGAAERFPLDAGSYRRLHEVKAITYHGLRVEDTHDGWLAEVIVDI
jgi:SHS2 domain-containing protein